MKEKSNSVAVYICQIDHKYFHSRN